MLIHNIREMSLEYYISLIIASIGDPPAHKRIFFRHAIPPRIDMTLTTSRIAYHTSQEYIMLELLKADGFLVMGATLEVSMPG